MSEYGNDERGRWVYEDYDGERLVIYPDSTGDGLWIDKRGEGPVWITEEDRALIAAKLHRTVTTPPELNALPDGSVVKTLIAGEPTGRTWGKVEGAWWGVALECPDSPALPATILHEGPSA